MLGVVIQVCVIVLFETIKLHILGKSLLTHQFMGVPFTEPTPYWKYSDYGNFIEFERKLKLDGISTTFNIHDAGR